MDNDLIELEIEIDEIKVRGNIRGFSRACMSVEITEPYQGLSTGMHIPYFARSARSYAEGDELSDQGKEIAEYCLRKIYLTGLTLANSKERFIAVYQNALRDGDGDFTDSLTEEEYREARRKLRVKFRHQGLAKKDYEKALRLIRIRNNQYRLAFSQAVTAVGDEFIKQTDARISITLAEQVIEQFLKQ